MFGMDKVNPNPFQTRYPPCTAPSTPFAHTAETLQLNKLESFRVVRALLISAVFNDAVGYFCCSSYTVQVVATR